MKISYEKFLENANRVPIIATEGSKIVEFFKKKHVLVTGATGFLGKLLVEKILRVCPEIERIHVLVRDKKHEDVNTRIDNLCNESLFGPLRKLRPKFQDKINVIKGDMSLCDLGLNLEDRKLITEKVNVIFHVAATIKFNEELSSATAINVRSTRDLLDIAEQCKSLRSFVYVSTAFSNCYREEIKESFYATPVTPKQIVDLIDDKPALESITKGVIDKWPNTYTFTKAVAENLVKEYEGKFGISVVRPGAVVATYNEPLERWNDNYNGASGLVLGAQMGILKSMYCHGEKAVELVPADYVTNCMIAAAYKTASEKQSTIPIYNYVSSVENKVTYEELMRTYQIYADEVPTVKSCWYYCLMLNRYKAIHYLCVPLLQLFPALILDIILVVSRKEPIMLRTCWKATEFEGLLHFFTRREWKYENGNTRDLWNFLGEKDQNIFPFNMKKIDWNEYHRTHAMGLKAYVLKEDATSLAQARKRWKRLYVAHVVVKMTFKCLVIYMAYFILTSIIHS